MLKRIASWYNGKSNFSASNTKIGNRRVIIGVTAATEYSRSALVARAIVEFYITHWKWLWTFAISVLGLVVAAMALSK